MIRSQKTTKKRQGWLGNARGSGGEAAKAHHKMRRVKKLVQKRVGKPSFHGDLEVKDAFLLESML